MDKCEKVIKALEECLNASCRGFQPGRYCPIEDDVWETIDDAIALLKAQEPVKPIHDQDVYPDGSMVVDLYFCGACEDEIEQGQKYCCNCGRAVKWDE